MTFCTWLYIYIYTYIYIYVYLYIYVCIYIFYKQRSWWLFIPADATAKEDVAATAGRWAAVAASTYAYLGLDRSTSIQSQICIPRYAYLLHIDCISTAYRLLSSPRYVYIYIHIYIYICTVDINTYVQSICSRYAVDINTYVCIHIDFYPVPDMYTYMYICIYIYCISTAYRRLSSPSAKVSNNQLATKLTCKITTQVTFEKSYLQK